MLVAAVLGGLLGMAAFRMTASSGGDVTAPAAATLTPTPVASAVGPSTGAGAASTSTSTSDVVLHVTSDPVGANVREDAAELCAATPCDITFKGEAADPTRVHKLVVSHLGFMPVLKQVKPGDPPLVVKLFRGGGGNRPIVSGPPSGSSTKPDTTATPNGFKDLPY